jgi:hypothetical protein
MHKRQITKRLWDFGVGMRVSYCAVWLGAPTKGPVTRRQPDRLQISVNGWILDFTTLCGGLTDRLSRIFQTALDDLPDGLEFPIASGLICAIG